MAWPWRFCIGPLVTLVTVAGILATDRYLFPVPNPGAITFVAVVFATSVGGTVSGLLSAAISIAYAAYYSPFQESFCSIEAITWRASWCCWSRPR